MQGCASSKSIVVLVFLKIVITVLMVWWYFSFSASLWFPCIQKWHQLLEEKEEYDWHVYKSRYIAYLPTLPCYFPVLAMYTAIYSQESITMKILNKILNGCCKIRAPYEGL